MKNRIIQIMQKEGLSNADFAEKIGISTSSLSHILNERNKPSLEVVLRIHKAYPHINLNWLLFNEGSMQESPLDSRNEFAMESLPHENSENTDGTSVQFNFSKENAFGTSFLPSENAIKESVKYIDKPTPKITEIRIFFDNDTYQVFKPEKNS